jgi:hypothetical protein
MSTSNRRTFKAHGDSHSGFTLVSLMVSIALSAIVALGAAYVLESSQNVNSFGSAQNEIDRLQYLSLQLSRNPAFILRQPGFEKSGPLYQCLQHSAPPNVDCTKLRAPASYVSQSKVSGAPASVVSTIAFQPNCTIPQACNSLTVVATTGLQQSSQGQGTISSFQGNFQTRTSTTNIPSYILVPVTGFNFSCVMNQGLITALNYESSQALCQPLTGTLSTVTEPLANFGPLVPTTTQTMTDKNCGANGFSSIGSFQDQTGCMAPVVTTTTLMAPPTTLGGGGGGGGGGGVTTTTSTTTTTMKVTPTTMPFAWNCTDGWMKGACRTGLVLVDAGYVNTGNPGSAYLIKKVNVSNGTDNTYCACKTGALTVVSCDKVANAMYYICK